MEDPEGNRFLRSPSPKERHESPERRQVGEQVVTVMNGDGEKEDETDEFLAEEMQVGVQDEAIEAD